MVWKKGESGNPKGRRADVAAVRILAMENCHAAFQRLVKLAEDDDKRIAFAANKEILDRGLGKPTQNVSAEVTGGLTLTVISGVPDS